MYRVNKSEKTTGNKGLDKTFGCFAWILPAIVILTVCFAVSLFAFPPLQQIVLNVVGIELQGVNACVDCVLRDTIHNIEPRANGTMVVWVTYDDVGAFCVTDTQMQQEIMDEFYGQGRTIFMRYNSVNLGSDANNLLTGCGDEVNAVMYYVTAFWILGEEVPER